MPTLLITGANRGLGLEFTRQYADEGWEIIACCRQPTQAEALQALARKHKIRIEALDVTDGKAIAALALKLKETAIDLLINNAGVPSSGQASAPGKDNYRDPRVEYGGLDAGQYLDTMKINAVAPVMVTQALTPHVLRGRMRKIIMISSRLASIELNALQGLVAYSASKAALNMAMRKIAFILKEQNVTVASLHPGWVQTDMGGKNADVTVEASVAGMRQVIAGLAPSQSGQFFDYQGQAIPW